MFFLKTPTDREIRSLLSRMAPLPCNYEPVGATRDGPSRAPPGYTLRVYGTPLGRGDAVFEAAREQLSRFGNYPPSFTRVVVDGDALEPGLLFATLATHFGFASLHPCRVLDVFSHSDERCFGFSLGTMPGHVGAGEERFTIRQDPGDDVVRYEVVAFSKPDGWLARLGSPVLRHFQRRFARETQATMRRHCEAVDSAFPSSR